MQNHLIIFLTIIIVSTLTVQTRFSKSITGLCFHTHFCHHHQSALLGLRVRQKNNAVRIEVSFFVLP
jgi:hypothetical protein